MKTNTKLSKYLKIKRIENDENLSDMSKTLDVTPSFLSAIENGKKSMPTPMVKKLYNTYTTNVEDKDLFYEVVGESISKIDIDLDELDADTKPIAISFATKLAQLDDESLKEIKEILSRSDSKSSN